MAVSLCCLDKGFRFVYHFPNLRQLKTGKEKMNLSVSIIFLISGKSWCFFFYLLTNALQYLLFGVERGREEACYVAI